MPDFFVSRNKADKAWAAWIAWQLEAAGYKTVVQDWDFGAGKNFVLEMQAATTNARRTIAVLSPDFLKSAYTAPEWAAAFAQDPTGAKRKLVPVRVRDCKPTGLLSQVVYIDLVGLDEEAAKAELLAGVRRRRAKPSTAPPFPGKGQGREPRFPGPASSVKTATKMARRPPTRSTARPTANMLTADQAKARVDQHAWGERRDRGYGWTGDVWLGAVIVPERQATPYIDVLDLGNPKLHEQVTTLALVGSSAIFRRTRSTQESEQSDHLLFEQTDDRMRGTVASLEVHTNGTLVYRTAIERRASRADSLADSIVIDEDAVQRTIAAFVAFAAGFYKQRRRDPGELYLGVSLSDIRHKHFGRLPSYSMSSFTVGDPRLDDPLRVPDSPLKITKAQLAKPDAVAKTAVRHIARVFRLENAYFTP
jgi:TIR domain